MNNDMRETHPYAEFEDHVAWRVIDRAIASLEDNGDVQLSTARTHLVGFLCKQLDELGLLIDGSVAAIALVLRAEGWVPAVEGPRRHYATVLAGMDTLLEGTDDGARLIADYLRVTEAEWSGEPVKPLETYLPLASKLIEAKRRAV